MPVAHIRRFEHLSARAQQQSLTVDLADGLTGDTHLQFM
jgi:hypothetical protein